MKYEASLQRSATLALLAFDATQQSVTDVDFPIDMVCLGNHDKHIREHRYEASELDSTLCAWQSRLAEALNEIPASWAIPLLGTDSQS